MKSILALVFLFSGSVFAVDESLKITKLPVGAQLEFSMARLEMPPLSDESLVCRNDDIGGMYMEYIKAPSDRYFPARNIDFKLVNLLKVEQGTYVIPKACSVAVASDCEFAFSEDLKDISFKFYLKENTTISDFRKLVESCGGKLKLPEPTPYP